MLVIASASDPTAIYFYGYLQNRGKSSRFIELEDCGWSHRDLIEVITFATGVYYREPEPTTWAALNFLTAIRSVAMNHPNVISAPYQASNWSKPLQMSKISREYSDGTVRGIETLVSNSAKTPCSEGEPLVVKSISGWRSIVVESGDPQLRFVSSSVQAHPVQYQKLVAGTNVRVHLVGKDVFACSVQSASLDYRYGPDVGYEATCLPKPVAEWCKRVASAEGLRFAGIDLMRAHDSYMCLEINPMPGYESFEQKAFADTSPISNSLMRELGCA
jgi:hypothetical protein